MTRLMSWLVPDRALRWGRWPIEVEILVDGQPATQTLSFDLSDIIAAERKLKQWQPHIHVKHPEGNRCFDCGAEC